MSGLSTKVLDFGYVRFVEHWGSDERIIEAARMSTDKGFRGFGPYHGKDCRSWPGMRRGPHSTCVCTPEPGDEKLLRYLYENKHLSPFEQAGMTVEVQAPIVVFREWHRHRTQSYNEMSGRYTVLPDLYYIPDLARLQAAKQSATNKQGSEAGLTTAEAEYLQVSMARSYAESREVYEGMLNMGVAREVARLVLPVAQYSRMRASANLRNWLQFLTLRTDPAAQFEIRQYANVVGDLIKQNFPRTYELWSQ